MKNFKNLLSLCLLLCICLSMFAKETANEDNLYRENYVKPPQDDYFPTRSEVAINPGNPNIMELIVYDDGKMRFYMDPENDGSRIPQFFSNHWGATVFLNGTSANGMYSNGYTSKPGSSTFTLVSNSVSGSGTSNDPYIITSVFNLGSTGVEFTQLISYINGQEKYSVSCSLENTGGQTFNDLRFMFGGDAYFAGSDASRCYYDASQDLVYVTRENILDAGFMGMKSSPNNPSSGYVATNYYTAKQSAESGQLSNTANSNYIDSGFYMQWNRSSLAPGATWTIDFNHENVGSRWSVSNDDNQSIEIGTTETVNYIISNRDDSSLSFSLSVDCGDWDASLVNSSSINVSAGNEATVPVEVTIPSSAEFFDTNTLTLTIQQGSDVKDADVLIRAYEQFYEVSVSSWDYGNLGIGETADKQITITNLTSNYPISLGEVQAGNTNNFSFIENPSYRTISANGSTSFTVRFYPEEPQTYNEDLIINISSPLRVEESIPLSGVGDASLVEVPNQVSNINFTEIEAKKATINWTNGNGQYRACFIKEGSGTFSDPGNLIYAASDDWSSKGDQLGSSGYYCVYNGTGSSVTVDNFEPDTEYSVIVLEYNGSQLWGKYNTTDNTEILTTPILFSGGDGSTNTPFQIANVADLQYLSNHSEYWTNHFEQTADIDIADSQNWNNGNGFSPIGNSSIPFSGSYDGQNNTISNLYINRSLPKNGLFGQISNSDISNLIISDATIISSTAANALLVAWVQGTNNITNCHVSGSINGESYVGGLIAGDNSTEDLLTIQDCSSDVVINSMDDSSYLGGLIGRVSYDAVIKNCYSDADITVSGSNVHKSGILIGQVNGLYGSQIEINNSYTKGTGSDGIGGFIGNVYVGSATIDVSKSFSINDKEFIAQEDEGNANYQHNFFNSTLLGTDQTIGATAATTAEMQSIALYGYYSYDFQNETAQGTDDFWGYNPTQNDGYPFLSWQDFTHDNNYPPNFSTPTTQVSQINFTNVDRYTFTINWTNGNGERRAVFMKEGSGAISNPTNTTTYSASTDWDAKGDQLGTSGYYCVYNGGRNSVDLTNLNIDTEYTVQIFEFEGYPGQELYQTNTATNNPNTQRTLIPFPSGTGTVNDPYEISTLEDLNFLSISSEYWDKHFYQTADIDASATQYQNEGSGFVPIGDLTTQFTGSYDGQNYSISNLFINVTESTYYIGLFGGITGAEIENIRLTDVDFSSNFTNNSVIVGGLVGTAIASSIINNCHVTGYIEYSGTNNRVDTGGIVGNLDNSDISQCSFEGSVKGYLNVGGVVGYAKDSGTIIQKSYSTGEVSGKNYIGGFIGSANNSIVIQNCYSQSNYIYSNPANDVGSFVGEANTTDISYCYGTGKRINEDLSTSYLPFHGSYDYSNTDYTSNIYLYSATYRLNTSSATPTEEFFMKSDGRFLNAGWDFMDESNNGSSEIWGYNENENNGYPFLSWQGYDNVSPEMASAPTAQTSGLSEYWTSANSLNLEWYNGNGTRRVIFIKEADEGQGGEIPMPENGTSYFPSSSQNYWDNPDQSDQLGSSGYFCVYNGSGNSFSLSSNYVDISKTYYIYAFEYNGSIGKESYLTDISAENHVETSVSEILGGGDGSEGNPYIIATINDLKYFNDYSRRTTFADKHFEQIADIDASQTVNWNDEAGFKGVGLNSSYSIGSYEGNGYTISNLYTQTGFFSYLSPGVSVSGINLENMIMENVNSTNIGGLVVEAYGTPDNLVTITDCHVDVDVVISHETDNFGGLVAKGRNVNINSCSTSGSMIDQYEGTSSWHNLNSGGIIGYWTSTLTIEDSYSTMDVVGINAVGAFIGKNYDYGSEALNLTIRNCYAMGNTSFSRASDYGKISNFIGYLYASFSVSSTVLVENCYATGRILDENGESITEGTTAFIGFYSDYIDESTFTENYYNSGTCLVPVCENENNENTATGRSSYYLKNHTYYTNWDFTNKWGINPLQNNGYPFLRWQDEFSHNPGASVGTAPSVQAHSIELVNETTTSITLNWTNGDGTKRAVFIKAGSGEAENPNDNQSYSASTNWNSKGSELGSSGYYCVFNGFENSTTVYNLTVNTNYSVRIFEYNIVSSLPKYLTSEGNQNPTVLSPTTLFSGGYGTEESPYLISTLDDLLYLSANSRYWSDYFLQINDIDASSTADMYISPISGFKPIGYASSSPNFSGSYDGGDFQISNMYIEGNYNYLGLFSQIESGASVSNVHLVDMELIGVDYIGGIIGKSSESTISGCSVSGTITAKNNTNTDYYGGIVGYASNTNIDNCHNSANMYDIYDYVGGIVGYANPSTEMTISNCSNAGNITQINRHAGGIVGKTNRTTIISRCYNTGTIQTVEYYSGGIIGSFAGTNSKIENCYNSGNISSEGSYVGGIASYSSTGTTIEQSYNLGEISGLGSIGGLCGQSVGASLINCYNIASVSGTSRVGGAIGYVISASNATVNCYNTGHVIGNRDVGGLVGKISNTTFSNSFWDKETSGQMVSAGGTGKTTAEMKTYSTFADAGWDFVGETENGENDYWCINPSENSGYPFFGTEEDEILIVFGGTAGTENNPYEISSLAELRILSESPQYWDAHFIQTANLSFEDSDFAEGGDFYNDGKGFIPIGADTLKFTGTYNGKGHLIQNLQINRPAENNIGLFGYISTNSSIDSLGVTSVDITGSLYVGALVGNAEDATISNTFSSGEINASAYGGGLIGKMTQTTIDNSFAQTAVNVNSFGAGLVSFAGNSTISFSYSTGTVSGDELLGGLIAEGSGNTIANSYWDNETSGQSESAGGEGRSTENMQDMTYYVYFAWDFQDEEPNGTDDFWGLNPTFNNAYPFLSWQGYRHNPNPVVAPSSQADSISFTDVLTSSITISWNNALGEKRVAFIKEGSELADIPQDGTTYTASEDWSAQGTQIESSGAYCIYNGFGSSVAVTNLDPATQYTVRVFEYNGDEGREAYFTETANDNPNSETTDQLFSGGDGTANNPFIIANYDDLEYLSSHPDYWNADFRQTADIDAQASQNSNDGLGFSPIGNQTTPFSGIYSGSGHKISSLYMNRDDDYLALFSYIENASIDSLGITSCNINGSAYTAALVGKNITSEINYCYSIGSVNGGNYSAGFVAENQGTISNSYSNVAVTGVFYCAGFIAKNDGNVSDSYSKGLVSSYSSGKGFIAQQISGTVSGCLWDKETSNKTTSAGDEVGKTTQQMKTYQTYIDAGWDFAEESANGNNDYWGFNPTENNSYPFLMWEGMEHNLTPPGTWVGESSDDWATASNWHGNQVPDINMGVIIPDNCSNYPVINSTANCKNITIEDGGEVNINFSHALEINGDFTLNDGGSFTNNGNLIFIGDDCHLSDNRSTKTNLGKIIVGEE